MGAANRTPVAIIHPDEVVRAGFTLFLSLTEGYEVVFSAATAQEFLAWPEQGALILLMRHPLEVDHGCGIALVRAHFEHLRIVAVARHATPEGMRAAARAGANGYLPMQASSKETLAILDDVRVRGYGFHPPFLARCVAGIPEVPGLQPVDLDEQHIAVLRLLAHPKEYSDAQIAELLGLKTSTVKSYRKDIHAALGVHSATAAVVKGIALGLIPLPEYD